MQDVVLGPLLGSGLFLQVDGEGDVRNAMPGDGRSARQIGHVLNVCRSHHAGVVDADVLEQLVEFDVLLGVRGKEVVIVHAGDRENRLAVALCVVEAVEQMDAAGTGGSEADPEFAGELGPRAGHEGGGFLVPDLDEADAVLTLAERFHDAVDAIARDAEDHFDSPIEQAFHEYVSRGFHAGVTLIRL